VLFRRANDTGDAPVEQVDLAELADHHVLGLHVAMDDSSRVRMAERVRHVREDAETRALSVAPARLEQRPERVSVVAQELA
jgi:hypothetical protein